VPESRIWQLNDLAPGTSSGAPTTFAVSNLLVCTDPCDPLAIASLVIAKTDIAPGATVWGEFVASGPLKELVGVSAGRPVKRIGGKVLLLYVQGGVGLGAVGQVTVSLKKSGESDVELLPTTEVLQEIPSCTCIEFSAVDIPEAFLQGSVDLVVRLGLRGPDVGLLEDPTLVFYRFGTTAFLGGYPLATILNVTGDPIICDNGMSQVAAALTTLASSWEATEDPPKLKLYKNDPALTPQTVLGDLTECDFTGYSEVLLDDMVAALTVDDVPVMQGAAVAAFVGGDPLTVPGQAVGYYIVNNAEDALIAVERFQETFAVDEPGDTINITARILLHGVNPS